MATMKGIQAGNVGTMGGNWSAVTGHIWIGMTIKERVDTKLNKYMIPRLQSTNPRIQQRRETCVVKEDQR